ncbi:CRISPR-associated endonuclease Cas6 [Bacteroides sp.]
MSNRLPILIVLFENEIEPHEIPLFRGCVLHTIHGQADTLYHNHIGKTFRYSYPLIQYKRVHKKAAIVCIGNGTEVVGQFLSERNFSFQLGERFIKMELENIIPKRITVQAWDSMFHYHIQRWLPLNSENYQKYKEIETLSDRISFLEKILIGNLLSFAKGINYHLDTQIKCNLTALSEPYQINYKETKLMAFNIDFKSNLSLPEFIGIGKNASIGYGILTNIKHEK